MLASNENRYQYVYFILSAVVACILLLLTYFSVKTTADYQLRDDFKQEQRRIHFIMPVSNWDYNNTWRLIGDPKLHNAIYSAYFDIRTDVVENISETELPVGSFRVFGILPRLISSRNRISCLIRYDDYTLKEIPAEEARSVVEHHDKPYAVYIIMCPLRIKRHAQQVQLPKSLALQCTSNRLSHMSPTFIPISYPRNITQSFKKSKPIISVCVGPLYGPYKDVIRLVEFVEMYRIQGATHFYFYNMDVSRDVQRVLEHYRSLGMADILPWKLDKTHVNETHYQAIAAQYNDCVYRAMVVDNYRYAAVVDLDEIIMPLKHNSLRDYLRQCDEGRTSAFIFRNVFFYKNDSYDYFSAPDHIKNRKLYTQTKVRRTLEILPALTRTKCVVNTRGIIEMGNHFVHRELPGYAFSVVHQTVGLLFHYRDVCINCKAVLITDYTARRYGSLIWDRVDEICLKVFTSKRGMCPDL